MAAVIKIDQATLPAGINGRARTDGVTGQLVTLTAVDPHTTYAWRIVTTSDPSGTVPALTGDTTATCTFTPTARETYLIELLVDSGLGTEDVSRRVFAIRQVTTGLRYPTPNEDADPTATLDDTGDPAFIARSADNEDGDIFGWSNDATQWYRAFETLDGSNLGAGEGVFAQRTTNTLQFKSLVGGTNISLTSNADTITINATGTGEANTASNLGAGSGVFAQKAGVDLEFLSLVGGNGITLATSATEITIARDAIDVGDLDNVVLTGAAAGDVLYYNGTNWVNLGIGAASEVLAVNAGATAPEWVALATGGGVGAAVAVNASTYTVQNDEDFILVDYSTTGVCTITLPLIANHETKRVAVKDRGKNAGNFNIVVEPSGAETIDGLDEYIITQDNDSITLVGQGGEWSTI